MCECTRELVGSNLMREHGQVESMNGKEGNLASVAVGRPSRSAERRREKDARITEKAETEASLVPFPEA
jgi:hypothetical protein